MLRFNSKNLPALVLVVASIGIALLLAPSEVVRVEPQTMIRTDARSSTLLSAWILTITSVELRTSTSLQIVQGEPPSVTIIDQKWNPPLLTLFLKNSGGSGTITLQFTIGGSSQYDTVHLNPGASSTYTRIFATLGQFTGPPDVQIIAQQPDPGTQTRTIEVPYGVKTYTYHNTGIITVTTTWTETSSLTLATTVTRIMAIFEILVGARTTNPYTSLVIVLLSVTAGACGIAVSIVRLKARGQPERAEPAGVTEETRLEGILTKPTPQASSVVKEVKEVPTPKIVPVEEQVPALDDRVYRYIEEHEGVISISQATRELAITVNKLKQAIERLKSQGRLG